MLIGVILSALLVIVVVLTTLFVLLKIRKHHRTKKVNLVSIYEEIPDIAISPTIHVEVNERGRIRRRTMVSSKSSGTPITRSVSINFILKKYKLRVNLVARWHLSKSITLGTSNTLDNFTQYSIVQFQTTQEKALRTEINRSMNLCCSMTTKTQATCPCWELESTMTFTPATMR